MSNDKMREEFEEALHAQKEFKLSAEAIAAAEWAWQASREAVVVDITWSTCLVPGGNPLEVIDACRAKVEAQGLRVKP
jgi:hypothetical protein